MISFLLLCVILDCLSSPLYGIPWWEDTSFFLYSAVDGHLVCFQFKPLPIALQRTPTFHEHGYTIPVAFIPRDLQTCELTYRLVAMSANLYCTSLYFVSLLPSSRLRVSLPMGPVLHFFLCPCRLAYSSCEIHIVQMNGYRRLINCYKKLLLLWSIFFF